MEYYASIVFTPGDVRIKNSDDPVPLWPFAAVDQLIHVTDSENIDFRIRNYFTNLSIGQFLCLSQTAINLETYGLLSEDPATSSWYAILCKWMSVFSQKKIDVKTLRALYNRRLKRFKELQKRYNVRGDEKVKNVLVDFLKEPLYPRRVSNQPTPTTASLQNDGDAKIDTTYSMSPRTSRTPAKLSCAEKKNTTTPRIKFTPRSTSTCKRESEVPKLLKDNNSLKLNNKRQRKKLKDLQCQNKSLEETVKSQTLEIKKMKPLINMDLQAENLKLKHRNMELWRKSKHVKELQRKTKYQDSKITKLQTEIDRITNFSEGDETKPTENESCKKGPSEIDSLKKQMKNLKRRNRRRVKKVLDLKSQLTESRNKFKTDSQALELYYNNIVHRLKNEHQLSVETMTNELEKMKELETLKGGKYKGEVRLMYYDLLSKGVSSNIIQCVVKTMLKHTTEYDINKIRLPSRTTAQRMVTEAGELANIRAAYEMAKVDSNLCHMSDGTTKHLIHWAHM